jgi:hypothetical protein
MASQNSISETTPSPTKTPSQIIERAERDLAASVATPGVVVPMQEGGDE